MKIINKSKLKIIIILSFVLLSFMSDILLIHTHILFSADDVQFHLKRVEELKNLLYHGHLFLPFAFNYFHGASVMGMYPYYSLIPLTLLYSITSSYINSYYIFFMIIVLLSLIISFWSSLRYSSSLVISYLFAFMYSFSLLLLMNMFYHGDLGLTTSLVFLPMCIFGILDILNESNNYCKLSLGIFLMSLCHIPSTVITISFIIFWIIINFSLIRQNKCIRRNILKAFLLCTLLTSIVWLPILQLSFTNEMITPGEFYKPILTSGIVSIIKNVGIISLISIPILIINIHKLKKFLKQMLILAIIIIIFSSNLIPVNVLMPIRLFRLINKFQFTSRFLIIPHILLCYLSSYIFVKYVNKFYYSKKLLISVFVMLIIICQMLGQAYLLHIDFDSNYRLADNYSSIEIGSHLLGNNYMIKGPWIKYLYNGYMNNYDYYPVASRPKVKFIINSKCIYNHHFTISFKHVGFNSFKINDKYNNIKRLELPLVCYNEEHLQVYDNKTPINHHMDSNHLLMIDNVNKGLHYIVIKYVQNIWINFIKNLIFSIGVLWILIRGIKYYFVKHLNDI